MITQELTPGVSKVWCRGLMGYVVAVNDAIRQIPEEKRNLVLVSFGGGEYAWVQIEEITAAW
jgi:hypothetical protein